MADKKKKKKYYNSIVYMTGCPGLNMKRFNQELGLEKKDEDTNKDVANEVNTELADQTTTEVTNGVVNSENSGENTTFTGDSNSSSEGSSEGGALGESLIEDDEQTAQQPQVDDDAKYERTYKDEKEPDEIKKPTNNLNKREVKRYYIRPQNVFCANKKEIVTELVKLGNENNCSIYTLVNLPDDDKDVHKLTNRDIIYYYDDGILYDKNHVKVMDYDLSIRKEEERKRFPGGVDSVTSQEFDRVYQDRVTEDLDNPFALDFESYNAFGEKLVEGKVADNICCICGEPYEGYGNNAEPYADGYCCDACNIHFVIPARLSAMHQDNNTDEKTESLKEEFDKEIPTDFDGQMDFLSADEEEAIDAYAAVIDLVGDDHVADQLTKIETEEKAHKDYLEKVKDDPTIDYVEPLEDEEETEE
jgi:hypothetical protein